MGRLFAIDGALYKLGTLIIDLLTMNFLWLGFTILGAGITGGAATSALYYVMQRRIEHRGCCNLREFFYAFKRNFKQATLLWIFLLAGTAVILANLHYIPFFLHMIDNRTFLLFIVGAQILFLLEGFMIGVYAFSLLAKYQLRVGKLLKLSFILAHKHLLTTVTCMALMIVVMIGFFHAPILFCAGISGYVLLTSFLIKQKISVS